MLSLLLRFIKWLVLGYVGAGLSMSIIAIIFFVSIGSPSAISSVIDKSGIEATMMPDLLVKSNQQLISNGDISDAEVRNVANDAFPKPVIDSISAQFSQDLHTWLRNGSGPFEFRYDLSASVKTLNENSPPLSAKFIQNNQFYVEVDTQKASINLRLQHLYDAGRSFMIIGPLLFIGLTVLLFILEQSRLMALYRLKRFFQYGALSLAASIPLNYALWSFVASRLSSYPKASPVGAVTTQPLIAEILRRSSLIMLGATIVYILIFVLLRWYLIKREFVAPPKQKHIVYRGLKPIISAYLKRLK